MAHYVVGDIQGCLEELQCLLKKINFDPERDHLICAGDLVNRGPDSLGTLRFLYKLGDAVSIVLGNHDLHLLAIYFGIRDCKKYSSLKELLDAKDAPKLIKWLRKKPLLIHLKEFNAVITHAGIPPCWSLQEAKHHALAVEKLLRSNDDIGDYLKAMYGNEPDRWSDDLKDPLIRARVITNYFTRMRFCTKQGHLDLENNGAPEEENNGRYKKDGKKFAPWFQFKKQFNEDVYFGHWAALLGDSPTDKGVYALDTGCVWGYKLTAIRLDDKKIFSCRCQD